VLASIQAVQEDSSQGLHSTLILWLYGAHRTLGDYRHSALESNLSSNSKPSQLGLNQERMRAIRYSIFLSLEDPESYPLLYERALDLI
jgi:hypothetical protein